MKNNQNLQLQYIKDIEKITEDLPILLNKFCYHYQEFKKYYSEDILYYHNENFIGNDFIITKEIKREETKFDKIE